MTMSGTSDRVDPQRAALYLRVLSSVHDEIADVLVPRLQAQQKRNTNVFTLGALMYLTMSIPLILLVRHFEKRAGKK